LGSFGKNTFFLGDGLAKRDVFRVRVAAGELGSFGKNGFFRGGGLVKNGGRQHVLFTPF
jgi:hypothetical protein